MSYLDDKIYCVKLLKSILFKIKFCITMIIFIEVFVVYLFFKRDEKMLLTIAFISGLLMIYNQCRQLTKWKIELKTEQLSLDEYHKRINENS